MKQQLLATEAQEKRLAEERDVAASEAAGVAEIPATQVEEVPKDVEEQEVGQSGSKDVPVEINESDQALPYILPDNQLGMESYQPSPAPTVTDNETEQNDELQNTGSFKNPVSSPVRAKRSVAVTSPSPPKPTDSPTVMATVVDGYHVEASPKTSSPGDSPSDSWFPNGWGHFFMDQINIILYDTWFSFFKT